MLNDKRNILGKLQSFALKVTGWSAEFFDVESLGFLFKEKSQKKFRVVIGVTTPNV